MKNNHSLSSRYLKFIALLVLLLHPISFLSIQASETSGILRAEKVNPTTVDVLFTNNQRMTIDFYGENIFRIFRITPEASFVIPKRNLKREYLSTSPAARCPALHWMTGTAVSS